MEQSPNQTHSALYAARAALRAVLILVFMAGLVASMSCANRQQAGTVGGAGVGAATGAALTEGHPAGLLLGALFGAAIGSEIGRSLDEYDRQQAAVTLERVPTHQTRRWVNPDSGHAYQMTPIETYEAPDGPCREFRMDARVGAGWEEVYGTACRQPDGSWRITES